ncbi:FkbM family methyltransferase [Knoellia sp. CPCC 206435]|uniref:FkbM family methyltransferase n=1 Tax=Knoellia terrae TaxID=3404797 RepID=UPI003B42AF5E
MTSTVFIDVGAHVGETVEEAVRPRWQFDRVFAFEPVARNVEVLRSIPSHSLTVVDAGWWKEDALMDVHDPGDIGASVHAAKARTATVERCRFVDAAEWMAENTRAGDEIWLKLNCEGAECDIIDALDAARLLDRVSHLLVHFDVEKIPGMAPRAEQARATLRSNGVEFLEADQIMYGRSHQAKTANWIRWTKGNNIRRFVCCHPVKWNFRARQLLYPLKTRWVQRSSSQPRSSAVPDGGAAD